MKQKWCLLLFFAAAAGLLIYFHSLTVTDADSLYMSVEVDTANGWEITALHDDVEVPITPEEAVGGDDTIVLRRTAGEEWAGYDRIRISNFRQMCVFVEDTLVFSNCMAPLSAVGELPDAVKSEEAPFYEVFSANPAWVGRTVTIVTRNYGGEPYMSVGFDLVSDWAEAKQVMAETSHQTLPGAMFGILALLLFGLFLYRAFMGGGGALPLLLLALAALLQMVCCLDGLGKSSPFSMYLPEEQTFFPLLPLLYLATWMKKESKVFLWTVLPIWAVYFASIAAWRICQSLPVWFEKLYYFSLLLVVVMAFFAVKCAKADNPDFRRFNRLVGLFSAGTIVVFGLSAFLYRPLFDTICMYLREAVTGYPYPLTFGVFTGVLLILFLLALEDLVESRVRAAGELENLRLRSELTAQSLAGMEQVNETLAVARHDELHHLRTLAALCTEQPAEAAAYAAALTRDIEHIPTMRFTENPLINAILSIQADSAAKVGVDFAAKANLPVLLPLPEQDISTVLLNLLDNAVEAAAKAPQERAVEAKLTLEDDTLLITVSNSLPAGFNREHFRSSLLNTSKADTVHHGYGIRSARRVVATYGNELCYAVEGDKLVVSTAMELPMAQ